MEWFFAVLVVVGIALGWWLIRSSDGWKSGSTGSLTLTGDLETLTAELAEARHWRDRCESAFSAALRDGKWLTTETVDELEESRPRSGLERRMSSRRNRKHFSPDDMVVARYLDIDLGANAERINREVLANENVVSGRFLAEVERTPLTNEQSESVITFDNRVHLLAAAGSGKTSVMVARAAYAVHKGFIRPEEIMLLAFNRAAADELQERVRDRFGASGISSDGVRASTFHSLGLDVLARATGRRPRLATWIDHGREHETVMEIVDRLRDADETFRYRWDLFRLLFAGVPLEQDDAKPDAYQTGQSGFQTARGEIVKSVGERMIADWLYFNGVSYRYECNYVHDTADVQFGQYRPDFYYPDIDVWHEHWGLDRNGNPPAAFPNYLEGIAWKRSIHKQFGTTLIETTFDEVVNGDGLARLGKQLTARGIVLDWNPHRPTPKAFKSTSDESVARLMRTFMTHVKSNSLDSTDLAVRLATSHRHLNATAADLFLGLYWQIHQVWDRMLASEGSVDFEDMLVTAADHIESGRVDLGHRLVLVDEFQDASQARARLVRALTAPRGRHLLAVGDDWQSINRFAGADLNVLTKFEQWFGRGHQLALTTTFRCTQAICDLATSFVTKNPAQFVKRVTSVHPTHGAPARIVMATNPSTTARQCISRVLDDLSARVASGDIATRGPRLSVFVLGRYGFNRDDMPAQIPTGMDVTFHTVHGSKGLEADVVIITGVVAGRYGFPSEVADDPVLNLAMADPDPFPDAEERRLMYVALTRARREVVLISQLGRESKFVTELVTLGAELVNEDLDRMGAVYTCFDCGNGFMVPRSGNNGRFLGCSTFPACQFTMPVPPDDPQQCPDCQIGIMVPKTGQFGQFLGCVRFPKCRATASAPAT